MPKYNNGIEKKGKAPKKKERKRKCPTFTDEQTARGYICDDGFIRIDRNKARLYKLKQGGGTRNYAAKPPLKK
tara:strand:- start:1822 stop:2040 length:219 start_codon:yes stop_codon:yes gene_type:complete